MTVRAETSEMNLSFLNGGTFVRMPLVIADKGIKETLEIAVFVPDTVRMTTNELFHAALARAQKLISSVPQPPR